MSTTELRARAGAELYEVGPEPADTHEHELWAAERRFACELLAELADWSGPVLRRAALEPGELTDTAVVRLLLDAAQECTSRTRSATGAKPRRRGARRPGTSGSRSDPT